MSPLIALPRDSVWPDYGGGGLMGLVGAIRGWLHAERPDDHATTFSDLPPQRGKILVFLLIDGLGDSFLRRFGGGSSLLAHRRGRLTSVFPSTTASAVTTVLTGLPPLSHGLTGWFIHDRRFGGVVAPLPMTRRIGGGSLRGAFLLPRLFPYRSLFQSAARQATLVSPANLAHSPFSLRHARGASVLAYRGLPGLVDAIATAVADLGAAGGYVHAYYPKFDALSHVHGCTSAPAIDELARIDAAFRALLGRLAGSGAEVVASADHGFIDSPEERQIALHRQAELYAMLAAPLFGERRMAWCEVRRGAETEFEAFARERFAGKAVVSPADRLVAAGLLGRGAAHRRLRERIGTHALMMEPGWTVWDRLPGERSPHMIGFHGGLSADEMWIPLIRARC